MMKLISHIPLALLILVSSMGVTGAKHYCGNNLQQVVINAKADPCCNEANMPEGCCHNDIRHFLVDEQYQGQNVLQMHAPGFVLLNRNSFFAHHRFNDHEQMSTNIPFKNSLPAKTEIYIKVQSFLV